MIDSFCPSKSFLYFCSQKSGYSYSMTNQSLKIEVSSIVPGLISTESVEITKIQSLGTKYISGSVPIENYSQLFSSFVNTLRNNHLKIEVSFTASNSPASPLTDNSPIVKSVKESASQLGLDFDAGE